MKLLKPTPKITIKKGRRTLIIEKDRAQRNDDAIYEVHDDAGIPGFSWKTKKELLKIIEEVLETPTAKCELCGWREKNLRDLFGHKLCEQCYLGETENPEHAIY